MSVAEGASGCCLVLAELWGPQVLAAPSGPQVCTVRVGVNFVREKPYFEVVLTENLPINSPKMHLGGTNLITSLALFFLAQ